MAKDMHLVNIYLKIHNKRPITMDDLRYLATYSPECFEKTCKNVIYNRPETKPIMEPVASTALPPQDTMTGTETSPATTLTAGASSIGSYPERQNITQILANLMRLDADDFPVAQVNATEVKDLLGNLYMEMLFPHNDKDTFFNTSVEPASTFDLRA